MSMPSDPQSQLPSQTQTQSSSDTPANLFARVKDARKRWLWSGLSVLLMVVLGYIVLRQIDWLQLRESLAHADVGWLFVALLAIVGGQALRLWRAWHLLGRLNRRAVAWRAAAYAMLGAQVINWLSPVRVGDVWRVWQLRHIQAAQPNGMLWAALAVLIEKSLDSLSLALLALTLLFLPVPASTTNTVLRLLMTAGAGALLVTALVALRPAALHRQLLRRFPQLKEFTGGASAQVLSSNHTVLALRDVLATGAVSVLMWGGAILTNLALAEALHIPWQGWMLPLLVVAIQTASIVSPVPGNVGVIPLVTIGVLTLAGLASTDASALGLTHGTIHYLLVYGVNLVWFLIVRIRSHPLRDAL